MSTRANMLKKVLRHFNDGNYEFWDGRMDFGEGCGDSSGGGQEIDDEVWAEIDDLFRTSVARTAALARTGLGGSKDDADFKEQLVELLRKLTPESREHFFELIRSAEKGRTSATTPKDESQSDLESLDIHYAGEMVAKLEHIVSRAARLKSLGLRKVPNARVQAYWEEAHNCYLYGHNVACAVLCRAILDSALEEVIDPTGTSAADDMIDQAAEQERLRDGWAALARGVRSAGHLAIHDLTKFKRKYPADKVESILLNARAVLEKLYS